MCYSLWYNAPTMSSAHGRHHRGCCNTQPSAPENGKNNCCNPQSSAPEDGQNYCPKHVEPTGFINKPLLLHLVSCLYYLYQRCTVKQISDNEICLLIKYIKSVFWGVAKRLSYIQDARCLKGNFWCSYNRQVKSRVF